MNKLQSLLAIAAIALSTLPSMAQQRRASPHEFVGARIDGAIIQVTYGRPYAKGREIWGGLVPYDKVWRTGADEATTLITQKPLVFGDTTVPAGAYTLWTLPAQDGSAKLIINKQIGQWGVGPGSYDQSQDLARVDMKKDALGAPVEQLAISVSPNTGGGGVLKIAWASTQYSAAFTVQK